MNILFPEIEIKPTKKNVSKNNEFKTITDSKEQIEEKLIGFLGGGETPFITVAEYHHPNSVSYEYIYYLTR